MRMPRVIQKRVGLKLREREGGERKGNSNLWNPGGPLGSTDPLTVDGVRGRASGGSWGVWGSAG